jgi:hypothetical protein
MIKESIDYGAFDIFDDPNFKFNEKRHEYTYVDKKSNKIQTFKSVTGFIDQFKEPFDKEYWSAKKAAERGISQADILLEWKENGQKSANLGTEVHECIENFLKTGNLKYDKDNEELFLRIQNFKEIYDKRLYKLKPIFQEKRVFSRKWGLAGTLDGLFELNHIPRIGDWKSNKKFTTDDDFMGRFKKLLYPFDDLYDNSLNNYSIQVSLYRLIIEEETGIQLGNGFIGWISKDNAKLYKVLDLRHRLLKFLNKNNLSI